MTKDKNLDTTENKLIKKFCSRIGGSLFKKFERQQNWYLSSLCMLRNNNFRFKNKLTSTKLIITIEYCFKSVFYYEFSDSDKDFSFIKINKYHIENK